METHQDSENAHCGGDNAIARTTILRGEQLRRDRAEHANHDLREVNISYTAAQIFEDRTMLLNAYAQFHPSSAEEVRAVVLANTNVPVSTEISRVHL